MIQAARLARFASSSSLPSASSRKARAPSGVGSGRAAAAVSANVVTPAARSPRRPKARLDMLVLLHRPPAPVPPPAAPTPPHMHETRAVILDFDGLIVDTETPVFEAWREAYRQRGHELGLDEWQHALGTHHGFDPLARPAEPARARAP